MAGEYKNQFEEEEPSDYLAKINEAVCDPPINKTGLIEAYK